MSRFILGSIVCLFALALSVAGKVGLDVYMMSRCPDAVKGMKDLAACFGNIQQLCVQEKLGSDAALQHVLCENRDIKRIGTYTQFAECLQTNAIAKWLAVARCTVSEEGKQLLKQNVADSKSKGMKTSLTFTLNGKQRCVFDSGHWVASEDGCPGGASVPAFSKSIQDQLAN
ncbi:hypothetical protein LPJ59_003965 [Coemansia sp. RSA 2399]|nr:hypothetical protein LPJ59_003965 [Coemansia sp. RSA 2399]KAJ1904906.1 hypothetical protein LPJ81_002217 [Coemansia sp. IMI 209127]